MLIMDKSLLLFCISIWMYIFGQGHAYRNVLGPHPFIDMIMIHMIYIYITPSWLFKLSRKCLKVCCRSPN